MPRLQPVTDQTADAVTRQLLADVKQKMGGVPNLIATMANSPAVAQAYLGFSQALAGGSLSGRLREQIALAVGQANSCDYCVAAHTMLGKRAGLSEEETLDARQATSSDGREDAALRLARDIVDSRGEVSEEQLSEARAAGFTDGEIAEIVGNVALNLLTNYFNHVAGTEVDFPRPAELAVS